MDLGNLIRQLRSEEGTALDALDAIGDIVLYTGVCRAAERFGETPGQYIVASVGRFAAIADDEAWTTLIGAMGRSSDPASTALDRMLRWSIAADAADAVSQTEGSSGGSSGGCSGGCSCHDGP